MANSFLMENSVENLLSLIETATKSTDNEARSSADATLLEIMQSDGEGFLNNIYQIISNHENPPECIKVCSVILGRFLTFQNKAHYDYVKQIFDKNENAELINNLLTTIDQMIKQIENTEIQMQGAQLISLILQLKPENIINILSQYIDLFWAENTPFEFQCAVIQIFDNIFHLNNLMVIIKNHRDAFFTIVFRFVEMVKFVLAFNEDINENEKLKILKSKSLVTLQTILDVSYYLSSRANVNIDFATDENILEILDIMNILLPVPDIDFYELCHNLLQSIARKYYIYNDEIVQKTLDLIFMGISNTAEGSVPYRCTSLQFLYDFSGFEIETFQNYGIPPKFIPLYIEQQFQLIIECICSVNEADFDVEEPSTINLSNAAASALGRIFKAAPAQTFTEIKKFVEGLDFQNGNWVIKYVYSNLYYIVGCRIPYQIHEVLKQHLKAFISKNFISMIQLMYSQHQRLREVVLWSIGQTIGHYPSLFADNVNPLELLNQIINAATMNDTVADNVDGLIHKRIISLLHNICRCYTPEHVSSPLDYESGSELIIPLILSILSLEKTQQDYDLIIRCYEALNCLYQNCRLNPPAIDEYMRTTLMFYDEFISKDCDEFIKFTRVSEICSNISVLMSRIKNCIDIFINHPSPDNDILLEKAKSYIDTILTKMFRLLDNKNEMIYTEAMRTIAMTIICGSKFDDFMPNLEKLSDYILESFESNNDEVIASSCTLISDMFRVLPAMRENFSNLYLEVLDQHVNGDVLSITAHSHVFEAMADIVSVLDREIAVQYIELILSTCNLFMPYMERDDESGADACAAAARGMTVFGAISDPAPDLRAERSLIKNVEIICGNISALSAPIDHCYIRALEMIRVFAKFVSKKSIQRLHTGKFNSLIEKAGKRSSLKNAVEATVKALDS